MINLTRQEQVMSADNPRNPGDRPDPSYQGAKPASISGSSDFWIFFGMAGPPQASNAMSAALARNWWLVALRGVLAILFGVVAILLPGPTLAALVLLFAAYMVVDGVLAIIAAVRAARRRERWGWLIFEGVVDLAAAAIVFFFPIATILAFVMLMGAWAIVSGSVLWAAAFRLNLTHGRRLMAFGGIISVIWGFLLILWPGIGALAVTLWMGAYALIFGAALLVLAFRLRRRSHEAPPAGAVPYGA
jgi:uncharacterized membrane protein HdeD (DUF308 family)